MIEQGTKKRTALQISDDADERTRGRRSADARPAGSDRGVAKTRLFSLENGPLNVESSRFSSLNTLVR